MKKMIKPIIAGFLLFNVCASIAVADPQVTVSPAVYFLEKNDQGQYDIVDIDNSIIYSNLRQEDLAGALQKVDQGKGSIYESDPATASQLPPSLFKSAETPTLRQIIKVTSVDDIATLKTIPSFNLSGPRILVYANLKNPTPESVAVLAKIAKAGVVIVTSQKNLVTQIMKLDTGEELKAAPANFKDANGTYWQIAPKYSRIDVAGFVAIFNKK